MPMIPAFCDTCGTAFPSGFFMDNCTNIQLSNNRSGPCPKCGGVGHVPDGIFNIIGDTIHIISAPEITKQELLRFAEILKSAQTKGKDASDIKLQIESNIPALSEITKYIPDNKTEWLAFIGVILAALQVFLAMPQPQNQTQPIHQEITINQVIHQTLNQTQKNTETKITIQKIGRNEPCPCNSGKKYKKCCG